MTNSFRSVAGWLLFLLPAGMNDARVEPPGSSENLDVLIRQLGDRQFRVRQAAGRALEARADEALPALRQALENPRLEPEVLRRIEILVEKVERRSLTMPKRITLRAAGLPLNEVLRDFERQTGYRLQFQGGDRQGDARRITLDLQNVPFWEAIDALCKSTGLVYNLDDQNGLIYFFAQDVVSPYTTISGPFRLVACNFSYNRYLNLMNIPRNGAMADPNLLQDNLSFSFFIHAEPKVPLLGVGPVKLIKAEDDLGGSLLSRFQNTHQETIVRYQDYNVYRSLQQQAAVGMFKANRDAQRAKVIRGKVQLSLLSSVRPDATVRGIEVGKKKLKAEGQTAEVEVEEVTEQNGMYMVTLLVKRRGTIPENDFNWVNTIGQKLELLDEQGRKFNCNGPSNFLGNTATSVHATYQFAVPSNQKLGKPSKLVLNRWNATTEEIEFEFQDVPLP